LFIVNAAPHAGAARLGVAVSRRVSGKAVTRNRIKRQIRESFRLHQTMLRGFDIFIVAQSRAAQAVNAELARSLRGHWNRLTRR
jgi:ribonuclease P protein component